MTFHPTFQSRERILSIGSFGTGKTTGWLTVADRLASSSGDGQPVPTVHVLDTESAQAATRALEVGYPHLKNVEVHRTWEWPDYNANMKAVAKVAGPDDWLVIDSHGQAWKDVQDWYITEIFGKDPDEFWLEARASNAKGSPLDGRMDWGTINSLYNAWVRKVIRFPGHVYSTAMVEPLDRKTDSKEAIAMFGPWGVKPRGQKQTAELFHTVLWMQASKPGEWKITTVKDRERVPLVSAPVTNFSSTYLLKAAKWRP